MKVSSEEYSYIAVRYELRGNKGMGEYEYGKWGELMAQE